MSKFITQTNSPDWGSYYELTKNGYAVLIFLTIAIILITAFIVDKKQDSKKINARQLAFAGLSLALAFVMSFVKIHFFMGGSVTLFSMFFICYVGYLYGVRVGLVTAFAYSLLQFIQSGGSYFLSPFQLCCDYFFAFTALGLAGIWYQKKHGLTIGYIVACLTRGLFHTIGGYIYWMDYMPKDFPKALTNLYSLIYNYSYILAEMFITLIVINLPPVKNALEKIKRIAVV